MKNDYDEMVNYLAEALSKELETISPTSSDMLVIKANTLVNFIKTNGNRRISTKLS